MKCAAVIGANYGDEGKGLMTDYLVTRNKAQVVIRFNGGAQAGHTVVTPGAGRTARRHVFGHFGAGALAGADTYLSKYFVLNPILFQTEREKLLKQVVKLNPVYYDRNCLVTTPIDMLLNQAAEAVRAGNPHGSCGVGFGETIERHGYFPLPAYLLLSPEFNLSSWVSAIRKYYLPTRMKELGIPPDWPPLMGLAVSQAMVEFVRALQYWLKHSLPLPISDLYGKDVVFEGAQGLGLSMYNEDDFPHVTRSDPGISNVYRLMKDIGGMTEVEAVYVTRSYLTRHGAGPLRTDEIDAQFDDTNVAHPWQGDMRFAELDPKALMERIINDTGGPSFPTRVRIACTHIDQWPMPNVMHEWKPELLKYLVNGPTRNNVTTR